MTPVVEITGLRKTYKRWRKPPHQALNGFDMVVEAGQVHGFLGQNGSGKTTTLRTLLGLIRPDGGRMRLLGREVPTALPAVVGRVGAIVESPRFFAHFSGYDTLSLLADAGDVARARVPEALELVGLRERAGERVKTYSLGMKQRLAIAAALLKQPTLLILDEPANGLDPVEVHADRLTVIGFDTARIARVLAARRVVVTELTPLAADLETVFLEITGTASRSGRHRQTDEKAAVPLGRNA